MSLVNLPAAIVGFILAFLLLTGTFVFAAPPAAAALGYLFPIYIVLLALCYAPAAIVGAFPAVLGSAAVVFTIVLFFVTVGGLVDVAAAASAAFELAANSSASSVASSPASAAGLGLVLAAPLGLFANAITQILLIGLIYAIADLVLLLAPPPAAAGPVTVDAAGTELNMRGALIGINVFVNFVLAVLVYPVACVFLFGAGLGIVVAVLVIGFVVLASIGPLYRNGAGVVHPDVRSLLGWAVWVLPSTWIVEVLGILFYTASLIGHVVSLLIAPFAPGPAAFLNVSALNVRRDTGTIVMIGGLAANLGQGGRAYNLATFVFVRTVSLVGPAPAAPTPTGLEHETGHHLNVAAFGSYFHLIGWINEGAHAVLGAVTALLPTGAVTGWQRAYAEQLASTNIATAPARTIGGFTTGLRMWG